MDINEAAERMATRIQQMPADDPLLRKLELASADFLRSRGFDISKRAGCVAALNWLRRARVEDIFWEGGAVDNAADWYIGEARIDGMIRALENRLEKYFGGPDRSVSDP